MLQRPYLVLYKTSKMYMLALTGVAQWIDHRPVNQKVAGLICLGCGPGSQ